MSLFGGRLASAGVTSTAAVFTLAVAAAAAVNFDGSSYARNVTLDANLDVFWTIDTDLETIRVAVHAKAATGWAGFGVSEIGGMEGADIVFYEVSTGNVTDAHAIEPGRPVTDECTQDWTLVSAEVDADSLVFEAERALNTGDTQDRVFVDDSAEGALPTRILTAWGDQDTVTYHGDNFAKGKVILHGGVENSNVDPVVEITSDPGISSFDVTSRNFTIPATRTWYERSCMSASELPAFDEYHAIGFEAVVDSATAPYVHHLVLRAFTADHCGEMCVDDDDESANATSSTSVTSCDNRNFAGIFLWAPGSADTVLPDEVGFLLGSASGRYLSLQIETHYNNPDEIEGLVDDSGVRVYFTEELRPIHMGLIQLGDPFVRLIDQPLPDGKSTYSFQCPSSCFEENFQENEVTVFSHGLHMHENGQRLETRQYRNNSDGEEVLVHSAEVEYYSFLQAGFHVITNNDTVTIKKGDRFETDCYYDTDLSSVGSDNVTFGLGSENEMCIDFIMYYPDQNVPIGGSCGLDLCGGYMDEPEELPADSDFERFFGVVDTCSDAAAGGDEEGSNTNEPTSSPGSLFPELGPEDESTSSPGSASPEIGNDDESTSSSSSAVPGLVPLAYAVTSAVALACAPLIVNFCT